MGGGITMRRSSKPNSLVAGLLILAMTATITGLFGAGATVKITSPASGATVSGVVNVCASVKGAGRVSYLILGVDDARPCSTNTSPYTFGLDTRALVDGPHRIFAEAYDSYGMIGSSKAIKIYVKNGSGAVQAPREPATRVAAKPKSVSQPAVRVAGKASGTPEARTVGSVTEAGGQPATSVAMSARGPAPEPSRTQATVETAPIHAAAPEYSAAAGEVSMAWRSAASRARGHTVVLNGRPVEFDVAPFISKDRLQVGFRALFEEMGATVSWSSKTRTARSIKGALTVEVPADCSVAVLNGQRVDIGMPATIVKSRMMIPVRFLASTSGLAVQWDKDSRIASLHAITRTVAGRAEL
jgi:hypothetical protein